MEYIEEDEIKIEYFESFECDPLRNVKTISCKEVYTETFPDGDFDRNNLAYHEECPQENESLNEKSSDKSQMKHEDIVEEPSEWYSEIDPSGKYKCKFCDHTYSTIQTLRNHNKSKHPDEVINMINYSLKKKRKKILKCHICQRKYQSVQLLQQHVTENHLKNLEKSCQYCDATFSKQSELLSHLLSKHQIIYKHTFICNICGYRTVKSSHYKQHVKTHQADYKMTCQFCDYATHYMPNLKIHERIHTNNKPYACYFEGCDYRSSAKTALRSHELKHEPEKNMIFCDKCNYKTVYRQCLKRHIASHERDNTFRSLKIL